MNAFAVKSFGWTGTAFSGFAVLLLLLSIVTSSTRAFGQIANAGTVSGRVLDQDGHAISNAEITLTSIEQGQAVKTKSNAAGEYLFSDVKVGQYSLEVNAASFENYVVSALRVDADQNVHIDAKMQSGSANTVITVEAEGSTIDTRSATVGVMINPKLVEGLPLDGENIVSLASLLPGVTSVNAPTTFTSDTGGPSYSVSGSRGNQNLFLLDGSNWNNSFYNTGLNYPPRLALEEVSVLLNNYKAQYGRNSGSIFNAITRQGTNNLHGVIWEYFQNTLLNAADYMKQQNPHLVSNQFGADLGGPIKKNKIFFFLSYQDLRLADQIITNDETSTLLEQGYDAPGVPHACKSGIYTASSYCADFTNDFMTSASGVTALQKFQIARNPLYNNAAIASNTLNTDWAKTGHTGTSPCVTDLQNAYNAASNKHYIAEKDSSGNSIFEIGNECFNSVAAAFMNRYIPAANIGTMVYQGYVYQAQTAASQPRNDQQGLARVDINLGKHQVDARFFVTNVNDVTSNSVSPKDGTGTSNYELDRNVGGIYFGSIGDTAVVTQNLVNIARAGYKRYTYLITPRDRTTLADLGSNFAQVGHPFLPEIDVAGRYSVGSTNSGDSTTITANVELSDSLSWTHGSHNVQFGIQYMNLQYLHRFDQMPFFESEEQYTGVPTADFLLGLLYTETVGNSTNLAASQNNIFAYAQDDWRATPRLTLNYGLRYELPFQWKEKDGRGATFIPGYQSQVFPTSPSSVAYQGDHGIGNPSPGARYLNLAPRVGLSYDLFGNGKTSFRTGFGIFFDAVNANLVGISEPYHYYASYASPAGGLTDPLQGLTPIPQNYVKGKAPQFALPYAINFADRDLKTPYAMAVNMGVQQRVSHSATLEANYVGRFGRHQIVPMDLNEAVYDCTGGYYQSNPSLYCPTNSTAEVATYAQRVLYPGFNYGGQGVVDNASIGTSNYNGLQLQYNQRTSKGVSIFATYTYSRSLDVQSDGATNTARVPQPRKLWTQYGPSDFNATHIFNLGWVYRLPGLRHGYRPLLLAVNDWTFGGIYNIRSGNPVNITIAGDQSATDDRPQRPSLAPGANPNLPSNRHRQDKINAWFNTNTCQAASVTAGCVWVVPALGTFGTLSRNSMVGPAYINTNFNLSKNILIPGQPESFQFRAAAFNVFNTPNLSNPQSSIASSTSAQLNFGQIGTTTGTNGTLGSNGRRIQLDLILRF